MESRKAGCSYALLSPPDQTRPDHSMGGLILSLHEKGSGRSTYCCKVRQVANQKAAGVDDKHAYKRHERVRFG